MSSTYRVVPGGLVRSRKKPSTDASLTLAKAKTSPLPMTSSMNYHDRAYPHRPLVGRCPRCSRVPAVYHHPYVQHPEDYHEYVEDEHRGYPYTPRMRRMSMVRTPPLMTAAVDRYEDIDQLMTPSRGTARVTRHSESKSGHAYYPDSLRGRRGAASPEPYAPAIVEEITDCEEPQKQIVKNHTDTALSRRHPQEEPVAFRVAARNLFHVLCEAEKFLAPFLAEFKQEVTSAYLRSNHTWHTKVTRYNRRLSLPQLHDNDQQGQSTQHTDESSQDTAGVGEAFREIGSKVRKHIEIMAGCKPPVMHQAPAQTTHEDEDDELDDLQDPSDTDIKKHVSHVVAQALLTSVTDMRAQLVRNVVRMQQDYRAAQDALIDMKRLKQLLETYRTSWQRQEDDNEES